MIKKAHSDNLQKSFVIFLFYFLLFVYPLMSFLWRRTYPLFTVETAVLFLVILFFCILLTVILTNLRSTVATVLSALLIIISFMVQFNFLLEGVVLCAAISWVLAWRLKANFHLYGLPILAALILGALFDSFEYDSGSRPIAEIENVDSELTPVIHILLDAFSGIDGLPPYPASEVMKDELHTFFDNYGFQVFSRAYSRHWRTEDSLCSAMNFINEHSYECAMKVSNRRAHILKSNALFESLEKVGYRINVYQTGHLNFCQSNPDKLDRCWTYTHPYVGSIRQVHDLQLRLGNLAGVLLRQSTLLADMFQSRNWFVDMGVTNHDPRVFSNLQRDILNEPNGRYFFAHVLLPHGPFAYLLDCSLNYETDRMIRTPYAVDEPIRDDLVYEARTGMYFEQMECSLLSLRKIFDNMKRSGLFERSIIVVHGDHGSLIGKYLATHRNLKKLTPTDYRSNFSTLFAVKFPFGKFQVDDRVLSLDVLLEAFSIAVQDYATGQKAAPSGLQILTDDHAKLDKYVFLTGTLPLYRVDINIFDSSETNVGENVPNSLQSR